MFTDSISVVDRLFFKEPASLSSHLNNSGDLNLRSEFMTQWSGTDNQKNHFLSQMPMKLRNHELTCNQNYTPMLNACHLMNLCISKNSYLLGTPIT